MCKLAINLCFLLWRDKVPKSEWVNYVVQWTSCTVSKTRARELLLGVSPLSEELQHLASQLNRREDELLYEDLLSQNSINILQTNVIFLTKQLKLAKRTQKDLAQALEVDEEAISRWKTGKQKPSKEPLKKLKEFFGLPSDVDLEQQPLFLELDPIDVFAQRVWLHQKVNDLSDRTLKELFPALKRLLNDP